MLRGLYTASAGMATQQRKHDAITNNIANLNTPGYKQEQAISTSFPEMLIKLMNSGETPGSRPIGRLNTGVAVQEILPVFSAGHLQETMRSSDFALLSNIQVYDNIQGEIQAIPFDASGKYIDEDGTVHIQPQAFFTVQGEDDEQYSFTRNGRFFLDEAGTLSTATGHHVIGQAGEPIRLSELFIVTDTDTLAAPHLTIDDVRMGADGVLYHIPSGGLLYTEDPELNAEAEPLALLISQIDNPYDLIRNGNGLFQLNDSQANPARAVDDLTDIAVMQGFIEASNVDPTQSMVDMMTAARLYEANQRVIQFYDRSLEKAVNEIGRV